jgi:dimethylhistidine N-methyltransferase
VPQFINLTAAEGDLRGEIVAGLSQGAAALSPKWLYDRLGSALFTAITELPEYYPTRTEAAIFEAHGTAIAAALPAALGAARTLVELGAGDGAKAERLFGTLGVARYVAIDISTDHLREALAALQQRHPAVQMLGVAMDFSQRLALPESLLAGPALLFYPGSSIGNFDAEGALRLLREAHALSSGGALLIGADLCKPAALLHAAYDDALGVTAAFNLNLLRHLNATIGSDFDVRDWRHEARVDDAASRVEMHLVARRELLVSWPGGHRRFAAGEGIHTENSHKWEAAAFESLLRDAGWRHVRRWSDERGLFGVFLGEA